MDIYISNHDKRLLSYLITGKGFSAFDYTERFSIFVYSEDLFACLIAANRYIQIGLQQRDIS